MLAPYWHKLVRHFLLAATRIPRRLRNDESWGTPRRILFNVNLPNHFPQYRVLIEHLLRRDDLELYFADPGRPTRRPTDLLPLELLEQLRPCTAVWAATQAWDLVVECSFASLLPILTSHRRAAQVFHGAAGKYLLGGQDIRFHPKLALYDLVAALSENHFQALRSSGQLKHPGAAVLTGYSKLDPLVDGSVHRDEVLRSWGVDPSKPTVLYAPSWNAQLSLEQIGEELLETLGGREITLLVKPHPMSLPLGDHFRPMPAALRSRRWDLVLEEAHRRGKLHWVRDQETARYLAAADILITDFGSTAFEFAVTERPMLFYSTPEADALASDRESLELLQTAAFPFSDGKSLLASLDAALEHGMNPKRSAAMQTLAEQYFHDPGRAGARLAQAVVRMLDFTVASSALTA